MIPSPRASTVLKKPIRAIMIGYGCLAANILEGLIESPHVDVVAAFPWTKKHNAKIKADENEKRFLSLIKKNRIKTLSCKGVNSFEFIQWIKQWGITHIFIGSWGEIIKAHLIQVDGLTIINCHPSKLPDHRGSNPYASVIRMAEKETAVTFHKVDEGIDTGPILHQTLVEVLPDDTGESLRYRSGLIAKAAIPEVISLLLNPPEAIPWQYQSPDEGRYFPKIEVQDGLINWQNPYTPYQVRGLHPWLAGLTFVDIHLFKTSLLTAISSVELVSSDQLLPYQKNFEKLPPQIYPGMILAYDKGVLWLASPDPRHAWRVEKIRLFFYWAFLPEGISAFIGRWLFSIGKICHA